MKLIIAFIKEHKLSGVTLALRGLDGLSGVSVSDIRGFGRSRAADTADQTGKEPTYYLPRVRLEIVCADELAKQVAGTIEKHAHTGLRGDGKIFVAKVEQAVRISTGERGPSAV